MTGNTDVILLTFIGTVVGLAGARSSAPSRASAPGAASSPANPTLATDGPELGCNAGAGG